MEYEEVKQEYIKYLEKRNAFSDKRKINIINELEPTCVNINFENDATGFGAGLLFERKIDFNTYKAWWCMCQGWFCQRATKEDKEFINENRIKQGLSPLKIKNEKEKEDERNDN